MCTGKSHCLLALSFGYAGLAKFEMTGLENIYLSMEVTVHLVSSLHYVLNRFAVYLPRTQISHVHTHRRNGRPTWEEYLEQWFSTFLTL